LHFFSSDPISMSLWFDNDILILKEVWNVFFTRKGEGMGDEWEFIKTLDYKVFLTLNSILIITHDRKKIYS
jgi:hypothetical protein